MTITIDTEECMELANTVPLGYWIVAGVLAWYTFAALAIRWWFDLKDEGPVVAFFFWLMSPWLFPIHLALICAISFAENILMPRKRRVSK